MPEQKTQRDQIVEDLVRARKIAKAALDAFDFSDREPHRLLILFTAFLREAELAQPNCSHDDLVAMLGSFESALAKGQSNPSKSNIH